MRVPEGAFAAIAIVFVYGETLATPNKVVPSKNSTFETVPPAILAVRVMLPAAVILLLELARLMVGSGIFRVTVTGLLVAMPAAEVPLAVTPLGD